MASREWAKHTFTGKDKQQRPEAAVKEGDFKVLVYEELVKLGIIAGHRGWAVHLLSFLQGREGNVVTVAPDEDDLQHPVVVLVGDLADLYGCSAEEGYPVGVGLVRKEFAEDVQVELDPLSAEVAGKSHYHSDGVGVELHGHDAVILKDLANLRPERQAQPHLKVRDGEGELILEEGVYGLMVRREAGHEAGRNIVRHELGELVRRGIALEEAMVGEVLGALGTTIGIRVSFSHACRGKGNTRAEGEESKEGKRYEGNKGVAGG
ncbi:hypothetical protein KSP39_PZI023898 [Platanthera zijinensis]|uniref:Uncharacterized protein n=1 Tax=Platanthera zijinensis TaxID=2320716 RepID=A0AAP0FSZ8_9ASPA